MSDIVVNVTNAGAANVSVSSPSTVNTTVGNGGAVNVSLGTISPGNSTVVSGTLTINSTTTLAAGSQAYVKNDAGTAYAAKLDIGIPAGPATNVTVGNTTTLESGNASVTGVADGSNLTLAFAIPRGPAGQNGINGTNGITPTFSIDSVSTLAAGSSANVTLTTSNGGANVALAFGIPRGDPGTGGGSNLTLSDAAPSNLGTASAGTSNLASRADHTHNLPVIAYANLSGVPGNFPSNIASVSGLQAALDGKAAAGNYVTGVNNLTGNLTLAAGSNITLSASGSTITIASTASGGIGANDVVDGGSYIGQIINGITITQQPQNASPSSSPGNWTTGGNLPSEGSVRGLVHQGQFLALASTLQSTGGLYSSSDGAAWSQTPGLNAADFWISLSNADGRLFASSGDSSTMSSKVLASADNGSTWSDLSINDMYFRSVAYGSGRYVGVGGGFSSGNQAVNFAKSSSDGLNWTNRSLPYSVAWYDIAYGNGRFCAIGFDGQSLLRVSVTSTDGITWSGATYSASNFFVSLAYGAGKFVAISNPGLCGVSIDGLSWSFSSLPVPVVRIVYAGGMFVAVCSANGPTTDILTSVDAITWTVGTLPVSAHWDRVAYGSNRFVAVGYSSDANASRTVSMVPVGAFANFSVAAVVPGGAALSYQWQLSTDAGTSWTNIANATSSSISLTGLTSADNGKRYRAVVSATGAASVTSSPATLTVP